MKDKIGDENAVQTKRMITQILRTGEYTTEQIQGLVQLIWKHRIEAAQEILDSFIVKFDIDISLFNHETEQKIQTRKSTKRQEKKSKKA